MADQNITSTTFAGESNPNAKKNAKEFSWLLVLVVLIISPLVPVFAIITYMIFTLFRVHYKVIGQFVILYTSLLAVIFPLVNVFSLYLNSFVAAYNGIKDNSIGSAIASILLAQTPLSIAIGGFVGFCISWWRYFRKPEWAKEENEFRRTPAQMLRLRSNIKKIQTDRDIPMDGRTLGVDPATGERVIQTKKEAAAHTMIFGGSGTGKTTGLMGQAHDIIARGEGLVFLDMKGSVDVPEELASLAEKYGRRIYHWTSQDPHKEYDGPAPNGPAYYDPLGRGNYNRRVEMILAGRTWSEDFYKIAIESYLSLAVQVSIAVPNDDPSVDSLADLLELMSVENLRKRSLRLVGNYDYSDLLNRVSNALEEMERDRDIKKNMDSMRKQIGNLRNSILGQWLRKDPNPERKNDISLMDAAYNGDIIILSVDSSTYKDKAKSVASYFVNDMMTTSAELRESANRKGIEPPTLNIFVDEFSAIGSGEIAMLLARCRDAGMPVDLSTQSVGDLKIIDTQLLNQMTGLASCFIVHRTNSIEDAEFLAGFAGKEHKYKNRQSVEMKRGLFGGAIGSGTGQGSTERVLELKIEPTKLQELEQGEIYFISKSTNRHEHVKIIRREGGVEISNHNDGMTSAGVENWEPDSNERVSYLTEDEVSIYKIDPTIAGNSNRGKNDLPMASPYNDVEVKKSNQSRLDSIFNRSSEDILNNVASGDDVTQEYGQSSGQLALPDASNASNENYHDDYAEETQFVDQYSTSYDESSSHDEYSSLNEDMYAGDSAVNNEYAAPISTPSFHLPKFTDPNGDTESLQGGLSDATETQQEESREQVGSQQPSQYAAPTPNFNKSVPSLPVPPIPKATTAAPQFGSSVPRATNAPSAPVFGKNRPTQAPLAKPNQPAPFIPKSPNGTRRPTVAPQIPAVHKVENPQITPSKKTPNHDFTPKGKKDAGNKPAIEDWD